MFEPFVFLPKAGECRETKFSRVNYTWLHSQLSCNSNGVILYACRFSMAVRNLTLTLARGLAPSFPLP
jgi:hypothetical protein